MVAELLGPVFADVHPANIPTRIKATPQFEKARLVTFSLCPLSRIVR